MKSNKALLIVKPVDVLIPTNGHPPHLSEAITAIKSCIPVANVFRADGGSLGEARQRLIDAATTDRFLFLDSDVVLEPGPWFKEASESRDCVVFQMPLAVGPLQRFVSFYARLGLAVPGLFFGTMATFFSKPMLKGIQIPPISGAEDLFIFLFLQERKVLVRVVRVPGMHHHSPSPEKGAWVGSALKELQVRVGFRKVLPMVVRNVLAYPFAVALASLLTLDAPMMRYGLNLWRRYVDGYFHATLA